MRFTMIGILAVTMALAATAAGQILNEDFKIVPSDNQQGDLFGCSISTSGDTAIIGAEGDTNHGAQTGSVYIYVRDDGVWTQQDKLIANDGQWWDSFGHAVSISGDTAVIGAYEDDDLGFKSGSAYIFVRDEGVWTQQAKLLADDGEAEDYFGCSVAILGDMIAIGASGDDDMGPGAGAVYMFVRAGGAWTQAAKLYPDDPAGGAEFGDSVAIDGDTMVIGARWDDDLGFKSGSAYIFVRDINRVWSQQAKLLANGGTAEDFFGDSVAISGDTVVIGAPYDGGFGNEIGSASVFKRYFDSIWVQQGNSLYASDRALGQRFGTDVSISGDNLIVGTPYCYLNGNPGRVYIFSRHAGGIWTEQAKLRAKHESNLNEFGRAVSILGETAIIGAMGNSDHGYMSGSAYAYNNLCAADINRDDEVDSLDFAAYLNFFVAGDPSADFNDDGSINSMDFITFLNAFVAGC